MKYGTSPCITVATLIAALANPVGLAAQEPEQGRPLATPVFKTLVNFRGANGAGPAYMSLVQGLDGDLYGTTISGGTEGNRGTVFKITPGGTLTTLHSFNGTDGAGPDATLTLDTGGSFYGAGGFNGDGSIFSITPTGTLTTVVTFDGTDGKYPEGVVQSGNGNFYGAANQGGANTCTLSGLTLGCGTLFEITPGGALTTLYNFPAGEFEGPGALVQATNGEFYGTTSFGGTSSACSGCGTVFKVTAAGALTNLVNFDLTNGAGPAGALIQGTDGNLYGTTEGGGANNHGTVFKMSLGGTLTTLYSFDETDGSEPTAALVEGTDGNFYGTTANGGANGYGTVFMITPGGTLTTLHSFDVTDGRSPFGGLVQATNGTFYGTAYLGGAHSEGTVFSLSVGLGPFVETVPTSGKAGAAVHILGYDLTDATSVTFNGAAAAFTVVSATEITATVPAGATSGKVEVDLPSRTLKSNVKFRVSP